MNIVERTISLGEKKGKMVTLTNERKSSVRVLSFGATIDSYTIRLKNGNDKQLVVSPSNIDYYTEQFNHTPYYFGATVGRYAGRLSGEQIKVKSKAYPIHSQNGIHLHGGLEGLSRKIWSIENLSEGLNPSVTLAYLSPHLEEGYPGNILIKATYTLYENNSLEITYKATSDQDTLLNLTNHVYFNLGNDSVLNQTLQINSEHILETDENLLPTGNLLAVKGTPYDFTPESTIDKIKMINGLDTCFCFDSSNFEEEKISYSAKSSGLNMRIYSNQPAVVVYAPPKLNTVKPLNIDPVNKFPAICFEMQNYPDAPLHKNFPSAHLNANQTYVHSTLYKVEEL